MGRKEDEDLSAAQIMYPVMQCADIFFLKADICQLGLDQRKVNVLALEYCDLIKRKNKPVILSHHMLLGLKEGQEKMAKGDPGSAIFMDDDESTVNEKLDSAFCPAGVVLKNPCLDYMRWLIFPMYQSVVLADERTFDKYDDFEAEYVSGSVTVDLLKQCLKHYINKGLDPVRRHFETNQEAAKLLTEVKGYRLTK